MFILTQDHSMVNTDYLTMIFKTNPVPGGGASIVGVSSERERSVKIADFDNYWDCEIAFEALIETLKARKELYSFE